MSRGPSRELVYGRADRRRDRSARAARVIAALAEDILRSLPRDPDEVIEFRRQQLEAAAHAHAVETSRRAFLRGLGGGSP